jgi:hypothetical protein
MSNFDLYISKLFLEAENPEEGQSQNQEAPANTQESPPDEGVPPEGEMPPEELAPAEIVPPEELELAKLAVRAIYFNTSSKDVHNLKMKVGDQLIPFEKIPDYFEKTKKILPILGFVEWAMDRYEGVSSKWTEQPEFKGQSIVQKIKSMNSQLPEEQKLDNGKRVYWTRIILNCLLRGSSNFNLNISDINEKNIKEVFRLMKQEFGRDTRGLLGSEVDSTGPGTF